MNFPQAKYFHISTTSLASARLIGHSDKLSSITLRESNFKELNLREFRKLDNLDASNCKIEEIEKFCLMDLKYLKILALS